jgi:hypothetical protein
MIFLFNTFIVKWLFFFIFTLIVSVKYLEIMIFDCVFHSIFICVFHSSSVISSSVTSSSVPLSFIYGLVHYTENIKCIRTWKMPYGINNNIFHGANKLQKKPTLAFSNWIKSLMKSAHAKHFQKLISGSSNYKSSPDNSVHFICYSCPVNWNL